MWGIAGYSEGGFCAANIGLQDPARYGYVGVLSGYFAPITSQVPAGGLAGGGPRDITVFGHDKRLLAVNTPEEYIKNIPVGIQVPEFFLAAGGEDQPDVQSAEYFRQLLLLRVADMPPVDIVAGGGHQALVWRTALTPMLDWMTSGLSWQVQHWAAVAEAHRAHSPQRKTS
jgi:S-formylglutathione hydrolase FrmB